MTNTETIKSALIKQIVDSGSTLPLSLLEGNIDLLINTALTERYDAIYTKVIGPHITEPELKVEYLKAGEWYFAELKDNECNEWIFKFQYFIGGSIYVWLCASLKTDFVYKEGNFCKAHKIKSIRPATREEIIKYFPNEFEIDSHGANDIPQVTDPHI